jgi:hypothetical protein
MTNKNKILVGRTGGKRLREIQSHRWEDNIRMGRKERFKVLRRPSTQQPINNS